MSPRCSLVAFGVLCAFLGSCRTAVVVVETGVIVETPPGSATLSVDVYDAATGVRLMQAKSTNDLIELPAGEYRITQFGSEALVLAPSVVVTAGTVTRVRLGAILVTTVGGAEGLTYDLYDAAGTTRLDQVNDAGTIRPVPAGTYVLKEYFNDVFDLARDVVVVEATVTTVPLGAIRLVTVDEAEEATYDIFDAAGETRLDQVNDAGTIRPVPAGTYVLTEYFNEGLVYASGVVVEAGEVTDVLLGALRYTGAEDPFDIYDATGETLIARPNTPNEIRSLPAGTYVLKPYFGDTIVASDVVVVAGEITILP